MAQTCCFLFSVLGTQSSVAKIFENWNPLGKRPTCPFIPGLFMVYPSLWIQMHGPSWTILRVYLHLLQRHPWSLANGSRALVSRPSPRNIVVPKLMKLRLDQWVSTLLSSTCRGPFQRNDCRRWNHLEGKKHVPFALPSIVPYIFHPPFSEVQNQSLCFFAGTSVFWPLWAAPKSSRNLNMTSVFDNSWPSQ